jgi:transposase-like protein
MSDTFSVRYVFESRIDHQRGPRRRFSIELKLAVVAETMQPGMAVSYVARRHGLSPSPVFRWRQFKEALDLARAKNRSCCHPHRFPEIPGEDGQRDTRRGPLERRRSPRQQKARARPTGTSRRYRTGRRDPPPGRRATNLWLPSDRRALKARAAIRRFAPGQCQAPSTG